VWSGIICYLAYTRFIIDNRCLIELMLPFKKEFFIRTPVKVVPFTGHLIKGERISSVHIIQSAILLNIAFFFLQQ
jgi:hypothetical protein